MGGKGSYDTQALKIVCEFHGSKVSDDVRELQAELLALIRRRAAGAAVGGDAADRLEITANLDRQAIEALRLELQRLARRYGTDVTGFRVEFIEDTPSRGSSRDTVV